MVDAFDADRVRTAYDRVANDYVEAFAEDLERIPTDRAVLDAALERLVTPAPVLDLGCGPAQVGQYLADRGVSVVGVDLAPRMLAAARRRVHQVSLACADMRALPFRAHSCSGAIAFYSIHHLPRRGLGRALSEIRRVLARDGLLVIATHLGDGDVYIEEFLGHQIPSVAGTLYQDEELRRVLQEHSFSVEATWHRDPFPHEYQSKRTYMIARVVRRR